MPYSNPTISKSLYLFCFFILLSTGLQSTDLTSRPLNCHQVEAAVDSIFSNELMETSSTRLLTPSLYQYASQLDCDCKGKVLTLAGIIYANESQNVKALESFELADSIFYANNYQGIPSVYIKLITGLIEMRVNNEVRARQLFEQAALISQEIAYGSGYLQSQINTALSYNKLDSLDRAKEYLIKAIELIPLSENKEIPGYVYLNIGNIYIKEKNFIAAKKNFELAGEIWQPLNFNKGLYYLEYNYAFLAFQTENLSEYENRLKRAITIMERDSVLHSSLAYLELGNHYAESNRDQEAITYLQKGIQISDGYKEDEFLSLVTRLFVLYGKNNDEGKIKEVSQKLLKAYKIKYDQINNKANKWSKKEFLLESKIIENESLKKKQEEAEYKIWLRNTLLYLMIALLLLSGVLIFIWTKAKKLQDKLMMEKFRTKLSQDLHDDVGTALAGISFQAEMLHSIVDAKHKDQVQNIQHNSKEVITKMRDMVWALNMNKNQPIDLEYKMKDYVFAMFEGREINYSFSNSISKKIEGLTPEIKHNVYLIFKESIYNFLKHSSGDSISIQLSYKDKIMVLDIQDNGQKKEIKKSGLGLQNMQQRAEDIGASYSFEYQNGYRTLLSVKL